MPGSPTHIGATLDALGIRASIGPNELVSGAVVLLNVVGEDGRERVTTAWTDGISWVTRRGTIEVALDSERVPPMPSTTED